MTEPIAYSASNASDQIARFLASAAEQTPVPIRHAAARILLNGLRAMLPGCDLQQVHGLTNAQVFAAPGSARTASVLFDGRCLAPGVAAMCNEHRWTAILLDEVEPVSGSHPAGPSAVAGLAVAQAAGRQVSGRTLLSAIVAGIEVSSAMCIAAAPEMKADRGFAILSAMAQLGSASAACVTVGADANVARHTVAMASMCGIGTWEMGGSSSAAVLTGHAARLGVDMFEAAQAGIAGSPKAIEGEFGSFRAYCGKDPQVAFDAIAQLGTAWRTPTIAFQPYSGDTFSQAPLVAIKQLRERPGGGEIDEIRVFCSERMAKGVDQKTRRHARIPDALALNSDPASRVAAAWLYGDYSFSENFVRLAADTEVAALRGRVRFIADASIEGIDAARVEMSFVDGRSEVQDIPAFPGAEANPLSDMQLAEYFRIEAEGRLSRSRTEAIIETIFTLDETSDVGPFIALLTPPLDAK